MQILKIVSRNIGNSQIGRKKHQVQWQEIAKKHQYAWKSHENGTKVLQLKSMIYQSEVSRNQV